MAATFWGTIGRWAAAAAAAGCISVGWAHAQGASTFIPQGFNPYQGSGGSNVRYGAGYAYGNPYYNPYYYGPNINPNSLPAGSVVLPNGQIVTPQGSTVGTGTGGLNGLPGTGVPVLSGAPGGGVTPVNGLPGMGLPGTGVPPLTGAGNTTQYPNGGFYQAPDGSWISIPKGGTVTQNPFDGKPPANVGLHRTSPRVGIKSPWSQKSFQDAHSYDKAKSNRPIGNSKPQ